VPERRCDVSRSGHVHLVLERVYARQLVHHSRSIAEVAPQVSVIGSGVEREHSAEEVGRLLAERGCTVLTGGGGEVMAAAARGAKRAGGTTIGILPGERREDAAEWIDHVVVTGVGHARNLAVAASGDAVIAVGGSWGTLAEIAFARRLGRPVVILEPGWELDGEGIERANSPAEAVERAVAHLGGAETFHARGGV
jgi:uncharacterized protein (TIGR00725 family)